MYKLCKPHTPMAILFLGLLTLSACNTIEGAGEDISEAGSAIDNEAEKHDQY